jgi:hypothetical protein
MDDKGEQIEFDASLKIKDCMGGENAQEKPEADERAFVNASCFGHMPK